MTSLDAIVVEFKLDCAAAQSPHHHFRVFLQALTPVKANDVHASRLGAGAPEAFSELMGSTGAEPQLERRCRLIARRGRLRIHKRQF